MLRRFAMSDWQRAPLTGRYCARDIVSTQVYRGMRRALLTTLSRTVLKSSSISGSAVWPAVTAASRNAQLRSAELIRNSLIGSGARSPACCAGGSYRHRCSFHRVRFRGGQRSSGCVDLRHCELGAYVAMANPFTARLVRKPEEYRWSSSGVEKSLPTTGMNQWSPCPGIRPGQYTSRVNTET
jgi:hypothetical protein